jgi:hypothetical protein
MMLEDLQYIFEKQIEEGTKKLYFMLVDGAAFPLVSRHPADDIEGLVPMLDSFQYNGVTSGMPRFVK